MATEEKILRVQSKLSDGDFDDVYRIYVENERGTDRRIGLITGLILAVICVLLTVLFKNMTFLFYAVGCVIVGIAYFKVPTNKKFIATNKLQFGTWRETTFYPHSVTTMEIFAQDEAENMEEEEIEEATASISTNSLVAYENARGFLFAEGKIVNQFLYIPKRTLGLIEINTIREFAENNCSGGYHLLESASIVDAEDHAIPDADEENDKASLTADVCDQYYGAKQLHLYDSEGRRVNVNGEVLGDYDNENDENAEQDDHTEMMEEPELDIEEAFEHIIAEDGEDDE